MLSAPAECFSSILPFMKTSLSRIKADLLVLDIAALDHTGAAVQLQAAAARQRHLHILRDALDALLLHVVLRHQAKIGGLDKVAERHALQTEGAAGRSR